MNSLSENSFIDLHTHSAKVESDVFKIVNLFPDQIDQTLNSTSLSHFSIGWHPWYLKEDQIRPTMDLVVETSHLVEVVAIGECGLDLVCDTPVPLQLAVFKEHVLLAEGVKKPVIIHCVRAFNELIRLKKEIIPIMPWIVHGFNANISIGKELIRHGFYFSLGRALLDVDTNAAKLFPEIAMDHFFLETDDADVSINKIYQQAAMLLNVDVEVIKKRIAANYYRSFNIR
jgi:TatD DNase family protein